jgi:hypothetical protein
VQLLLRRILYGGGHAVPLLPGGPGAERRHPRAPVLHVQVGIRTSALQPVLWIRHFKVNPDRDTDPILNQGFDDQILKKKS